jgi:preprotein translocase subunit SecG
MGGGNSRMTLENRITNSLENNIKNHVNLINKTSQSVTQKYVDKVKTDTSLKSTISQITRATNLVIRDDGEVLIEQNADISASLLAQNKIRNQTTDRTELASVMTSALEQAVKSQGEMDTSQKAMNIMEQLDQNNGGPEGVVGRMADTLTAAFGGGNTDQNVDNILSSTTKMNTNNDLNMENVIDTSVNKELSKDTETVCKADLNIEQITELKNVTVRDRGKFKDVKDATINSAVECFNEIFNINDIATGLSTASGMSAEQALENLSELKSKQDVTNKLKQTKLQKNAIDSLMNGGILMAVIIGAVVIGGGMLLKGDEEEGQGSGSGSGRSGGSGKYLKIFMWVFMIILIGGIIWLCYQHIDALKPTTKEATKNFKSILQKAPTLVFKNTSYNTIQIFNKNKTHQLTIKNDIDNTRKLEFCTTFNITSFIFEKVNINVPKPTTNESTNFINHKKDPVLYKIKTPDGKYQLGISYDDNVNQQDGSILYKTELYEINNSKVDLDNFTFTVSPELNKDGEYILVHNMNKELTENKNNNMTGTLFFNNNVNTDQDAHFKFFNSNNIN